ncbi:MAG TPA: hypothetical protein VII82_09800, partial [Polyangiaceae bacterium]
AVIEQAIVGLQEDLVRSLSETPQGDKPDTPALFERVFETLHDRGYGRLMAWLLLSGYDPFNETARANWTRIGEASHGIRTKRFKGRRKPLYEDTMFAIVLSALALFGQAIAGQSTLRVAGFGDDPDAPRRFRQWLAALLAKHMEEGPP